MCRPEVPKLRQFSMQDGNRSVGVVKQRSEIILILFSQVRRPICLLIQVEGFKYYAGLLKGCRKLAQFPAICVGVTQLHQGIEQ